MANEPTCLKCGAPLTADARDGVCPICLLGQALAADVAGAAPAGSSEMPGEQPVPEAGDRVGRYKLLQKIGEGGCGLVYMAEQEEPVRRRVALKVIKLGMDTREVIARFEAERQALALMDHPNIAKVFDGGATDTGRPYFVMELVRGIRITDFCNQNNYSTRQRLDLFMQVCQAVQHAHQKGIIHRDLKPSNILVSINDGVPVPKVIDFGIAKATEQRLTDKTLFTRFHQFIGTPAYISPEQAEMTSLDIDTRSDIYSLGVLLYELLTGKTPFDSKDLLQAGLDEMRRIIREQEPMRPSTRLSTMLEAERTTAAKRRGVDPPKLVNLVRGDLDWIVMKCLEKDRVRRYASANALADDLKRHLTDRPVEASPPSVAYRVRRFLRRNRVWVGSAALITAILVTAVIVSLRLAVIAVSERDKARQAKLAESVQRQTAETIAAEKREQLVRQDVSNGIRAMENEDWFGALLWFTEALRQDVSGSTEAEMHRYRIGAILKYSPRLVQAWFHEGPINQAAFSPDGLWALTASRDHTARLWNVLTGDAGPILRHSTNVSQAKFSGDGQRILTVSDDGSVRVWDPATGLMTCPPLELGYQITHALISPDGRRIFTVGDRTRTNLSSAFFTRQSEFSEPEGELGMWDASTGRQVRSPFRLKKRFTDLALSADGQWLAAAVDKFTIVWNLHQSYALQLFSGIEGKTNFIPRLESSESAEPSGASLPEIRVRKLPGGREDPFVSRVSFSPDSQRILTAYTDASARVWPLAGGSSIQLPRHKTHRDFASRSSIEAARFSSDGLRIMLMYEDGITHFWNALTGESEGQLKAKNRNAWLSSEGWFACNEIDESISRLLVSSYLTSTAFGRDGVTLLIAGSDGVARLWNLSGTVPIQPAFKHDWGTVVAHRANIEESAGVGVMPRGMRESFSQCCFQQIRCAAFSPDSRRVLTVAHNGSARVWDTLTGEPVTPYVTLGCFLEFGVFNLDGTRFAVVGGNPPVWEEGLARVWDTRTGQPVTPVLWHAKPLEFAEFSPDGQWLLTCAYDGAQIWDAETGAPATASVLARGVSEGSLRSAAFSQDGRVIALCTGSNGYWTTRVCSASTSQSAARSLEGTNEWTRMEFSPDGRWLVTLVDNAPDFVVSLRIWNVATSQPVTPIMQTALGFAPKAFFRRDGQRFVLVGLVNPIAVELASGRILTEWGAWALKMQPDVVTLDGERMGSARGGKLRVWDARTGEAVIPPLRSNNDFAMHAVAFSPDGSVVLDGGEDRAQLWSLPKDDRPPEELALLAQLLAGRKIDTSGHFAQWPYDEANAAWQLLRKKYPDTFEVAPRQVRAWRERIVESAETERQWSRAVFHLEQLVKEHPKEESLRLRRAYARNQVALEELK